MKILVKFLLELLYSLKDYKDPLLPIYLFIVVELIVFVILMVWLCAIPV